MAANQIILALNSGSSSLKFGLYHFAGQTETLLATGKADRIGETQGRLQIQNPDTNLTLDSSCTFQDSKVAFEKLFSELERHSCPKPTGVGHRVVNGGADNAEPQRITPEALDKLRGLIPLAPLHLPSELALIELASARFQGIPHVACFDSAFHRRMPELAQWLPLPRAFRKEGLRRYGFHGLSYEFVLQELGAAIGKERVIIAHLGNGSSLAAIRSGKPLDTTMGFTPSGGVMMGTRTGDLDPSIMLYLLREKHYNYERLQKIVDCESGLLGVSETTLDMKILLEERERDPRAREAVALYCYLIRKQIGALTAVLGGLDGLIFTGGIGEHAAAVREDICKGFDYLGLRLDSEKNETHQRIISQPGSGCTVRVVATNEELMIARHAHRTIAGDLSNKTQ